MNKQEIISILSGQKHLFSSKYGITKLGLFGSAARGENPNDIDVIIEFESGKKDLFEKKNKIRNTLESKFQLPVDLCREKFIRAKVRGLILNDAIFV